MMLNMFKSKIHRATVTEAKLNYAGSLTLDLELIEAADMRPFERVQVLNLSNGARFETYVIEGGRGSGTVCLNGPAARLGQRGDLIIILAYVWIDEKEAENFHPKVVHVDENNKVVHVDSGPE